MNEEERKLQEKKIDQLDWIAALLERIAWQQSPVNTESFDEYLEKVRARHKSTK